MILKPIKLIIKSVVKITATVTTLGIIYIITTGNTSQVIHSLQNISINQTATQLKNFITGAGIVKIIPPDQTITPTPTIKPTQTAIPTPQIFTLYYPNNQEPIFLTRTTTKTNETFNLFNLADYTPVKLHLNISKSVTLHCKILTSKSALALGYMYKPKIDKYECLVFAFKEPSTNPFYMKNVKFPLDIIFFDKDLNVITVINKAPPCTQKDCPLYFSPKSYRIVIEMKGGNWKEFTQ